MIGSPWLGASARRTLRGTTASKTSSPNARRTSAATSAAEPGASVDHRQQHSGDRQPRVQARADELDRVEELGETLERVVLALHGNEHAVGRGERVHGQRAERRGAVDEDERVRRPPRPASDRRRYVSPSSRRASSTTAPASSGRDGTRSEVRKGVSWMTSSSGAPSSRS